MHPAPVMERPSLETRLAALRPGLDLLGLPACVIDGQRRYRYVNRAYAAHTGRDFEAFVGQGVDQLFPRPTDARRAHLDRALAGETVIYNRRNKQGPKAGQWVRAHYLPLAEDPIGVLGVLVVLIDVQQLKDAESALADRERQLSLITDVVGFPITYVDRDGVIRFANGPSREWTRRGGVDDPVGRRILEVTHPEVAALMEPLLARALAGESVNYEGEAMWPGRGPRPGHTASPS